MQRPVIFDRVAALRGQVIVRLVFGGAIILLGLSAFHFTHTMPRYAVAVGIAHMVYAGAIYVVGLRRKFRFPDWLLHVCAVADAAVLTGWTLVLGPYAQLVVPFYVFSAIGYGMRTGSKGIMHSSQVASLVGLAMGPLVPYWRDHISFWLSCMISIVIIPGYVGILMDKLYLALRYAESESMAKSELLARASHELRTPLGGISNAAELLRNEIPNQRQKRLAETILSLSSHLLSDINALLDQSRLSVGKLTLSVDTVDLEQQLEVVRASVEMKAQKKGLAFSATLDPRITDAVLGDQHWLVRVLINLLGNAVKFTDFGSVALQISMLQQHDDAYTIRFSVRDTGMGIAKEFQQRIFDPFVQVPGQSNAHSEGAGLGLAISKQAVELMGGDLRLISEIGMGSTFWFDLRMQRTRKARPEERAASLDDELLAEDVDRRRILVVDDNQTNRYLLEELLQREGHSVVTAASGEQALDILSGPDRFDLLLLDYNLGAMDGSVLLQTYRFGRRDAAPAYFLTADATAVTGEKLRNTGALGVLTKPVRLRELRAAIRAACEGESESDALLAQGQGEAPTVGAGAPAAASGSAGAHLRPVPVVFVDLAVIDRLRQIGTRQVFIKELLDRASEDIEANTERILEALAGGDVRAARDAGHALKGVCMETGAMRLMNMALGVMRTEDAYLLENRGRIAAELRETSMRTREALRGIVAETMQQAAGF